MLLLEGGSRILNTYPEVLSAKAARQLQKLGVEVRVGAPVSSVDEDGVTVKRARITQRISARTVLWAAGVQATALANSLPGPHDRAGRILVTPTLQLPDADSIFVIGDLASVTQDGKPVPGVAYAAKQMGAYVARSNFAACTESGEVTLQRCSVSLSRSRIARDDRAQSSRRGVSRRDSFVGLDCVVDVAPGAHFFPDRFSQSHHDDGRLDAGVHHASAARASDFCGRGDAGGCNERS